MRVELTRVLSRLFKFDAKTVVSTGVWADTGVKACFTELLDCYRRPHSRLDGVDSLLRERSSLRSSFVLG